MYFPPVDSDEWETKSVEECGWNADAIEPLLSFLESNHTKAFMILQDGKIVIESYMNNFTSSDWWYWASAGKTLTTGVTTICQDEGYCNIDDKVSDYLGNGWTSMSADEEDLVDVYHLLTMTSGVNQKGNGREPEDLTYKADAGERWEYQNMFVLLQDIVANATDRDFDVYLDLKLKEPIGMDGRFISYFGNVVYYSTARSMARFGILALNKGKWENKHIISEDMFTESITVSQDLNKAYGYLWWLNGGVSYMLPESQRVYPGQLLPNAPSNGYFAMGHNEQRMYVSPDNSMIVLRLGETYREDSDTAMALSEFDTVLWDHINHLTQTSGDVSGSVSGDSDNISSKTMTGFVVVGVGLLLILMTCLYCRRLLRRNSKSKSDTEVLL